jgi:O-acetyl-ADP-ribose deacetylase (regulator of RNase III)
VARFMYLLGDITKVETDAIITLISPQGSGSVDRAIRNVAGNQYHYQAWKVFESTGLQNGQVIVAKKIRTHAGRFENVIFVVDDLTSPLNELLYKGLIAAKEQGYNHVAIPLMRTGTKMGKVEKSVMEVIHQINIACKKFKGKSKMTITIVCYENDFIEWNLLLEKMDL